MTTRSSRTNASSSSKPVAEGVAKAQKEGDGSDLQVDEAMAALHKNSLPSRKADASSAQWERWTVHQEAAARSELIEHYLDYARTIAATTYARRTHNDIEFEEYMQFAIVGLIESVDRFDPSFGVLFRTFAARRVLGSILNGLVRLTEKNQQIAVRTRLGKERLDSLKASADEQSKSKPSRERSQEELFRYLADIGVGLALGVLLDGSGMVDAEAFGSSAQAISPEVSYFRRTEIEDLRRALQNSMVLLTRQQQTVIRYHYLQEMPFEEIARIMELTRGRISQIHKQSLSRLRELLAERNHCDFNL